MEEKTIDSEAMGKLANALAFIPGADHPVTGCFRSENQIASIGVEVSSCH